MCFGADANLSMLCFARAIEVWILCTDTCTATVQMYVQGCCDAVRKAVVLLSRRVHIFAATLMASMMTERPPSAACVLVHVCVCVCMCVRNVGVWGSFELPSEFRALLTNTVCF